MYSQGNDHLNTQHLSSRNMKPTSSKTGSSRGLTVQEIKAMTAMRLAHDQESTKISPDRPNQQHAYTNQQPNLYQKGNTPNVRKQSQNTYVDQHQPELLSNNRCGYDLKSQLYRQQDPSSYIREVNIIPPAPVIPPSKSLSIQELKELTKLRLKAGGGGSLNTSVHEINIHNDLHYDSDSVVSNNYGGLAIPHASRSNNTSPETGQIMYRNQTDSNNNSSVLSSGQYIKKPESLNHSHHSQTPHQPPQRTLSRPQSYSSSKQMNTFAALGSSPPDQFHNMLHYRNTGSLNNSGHSNSFSSASKNARPIDELMHCQQLQALFGSSGNNTNSSISNSSSEYVSNGGGSSKFQQPPLSSTTLSNFGHSMGLYPSSNNIMSLKSINLDNSNNNSNNNSFNTHAMNSLSIDSYDFLDGMNQTSSSASSSASVSASKYEDLSTRLNRQQYASSDPWKFNPNDYTLSLNDINDSNSNNQQQQQPFSKAISTSNHSQQYKSNTNAPSGFDYSKDFFSGSTTSNHTNSTNTSTSNAISVSPQLNYNLGDEDDNNGFNDTNPLNSNSNSNSSNNNNTSPGDFPQFMDRNNNNLLSHTQLQQNNNINIIDNSSNNINSSSANKSSDDYTDGMLLKPPGFDSYMLAKSRYQQQQQQKYQDMLSSKYNDGKMRLDTETMTHNGSSLDMLAPDSDDSDLPSLSTHRSGTDDSLSPLLLLTHTSRSRTASYCDLATSTSPKSPKTMRNRTKLPIQCPGMLRSRSMSDSTNLPFEMIESILMSATNSPMPSYARSNVVQGMTRFSRASSSEDAAALDTSAHVLYDNTYNNSNIILQPAQFSVGQQQQQQQLPPMRKNPQQKSSLFQSETVDWSSWSEKNQIELEEDEY